MSETWRPVGGAPRYDVSDLGRVRSRCRPGRPLILRQPVTSKGYRKVTLYVPGAARVRVWQVYVHQLVAAAFIGPCPPGHEVDHVDWNRHRNVPGNLRYLHADVNRWRWRDEHVDPAELARVAAMPVTYDDEAWSA